MALITVKKENKVLSIEESELERYLAEGYTQVKYDNRSGDYKEVTQKKTVNDTEFAAEMTPQAQQRDAMNPTSDVEFGAEISVAEAAKLGGTPADVAAAAGDSQAEVMRNGNVATPSGAQDMEFGAELTPDNSPAGLSATAAAAAQEGAALASEGAALAAQQAPNADYSGEFATEMTPEAGQAAKAARKRKQ